MSKNIFNQMGDWGINAAEEFALREAAKKAGVNYDGRTFSRRAGENPQVNQLMHLSLIHI